MQRERIGPIMDNRAINKTRLLLVNILLVAVLLEPTISSGGEGTASDTPGVELVKKLHLLTAAGPGRPVEEEQQVVKELASLGEAVVPLIMDSLCEEITESNDFFQRRAIEVLGDIPGSLSTRALLTLALYHHKEHAFFDTLVRTPLMRRKIDCAISEKDLSMLIANSKKREVEELASALDTVQILSQCVTLDLEVRLSSAKELLFDVLNQSSTEAGSLKELTPESKAAIVKGVMLAASNVGTEGQVFWRNVLRKSKQEQEHLWVTAALGMCGDDKVSAVLKEAVTAESEIYLRAVLVMAYARACKHDAIPFLQELEKDENVAFYRHGYAVRPVADAARAELLRLNSK